MIHAGWPKAPAQCAAMVSTVITKSVAATAAANQGKALGVVVQAQRRKGQIVFQLRGAGLRLDGAPRVLEPVPPLCENVVDDALNTVGVGALGVLGQGEPGDMAGEIQPTEVEQIFRRSSQNFSREHG